MPETAGEIAAPISGGPQHAPSPTTRAATECEWKPAGLAQRSATARATTVALTMQSLLMETTSKPPIEARRERSTTNAAIMRSGVAVGQVEEACAVGLA